MPQTRARAQSHPVEVRKANLTLLVAAALKRTEPFTRADLAGDTGLSLPTVSGLVNDLVSRGLFTELGTRRLRIGRSPSLLEFNARYGFLVGLSIGSTLTRLVITDLGQKALAASVMATPARQAPPRTIGELSQKVYELMADHELPAERVIAVGAGVPGLVDEKTGSVVTAPSLSGWHGIPVREILESAFPAPVVVTNEVHLAIMAEHARGVARGHDRCAFISVGSDISASVLLNGHVERGSFSRAGQIGRMCIDAEAIGSDDGNGGFLEALAGVLALERKVPLSDGEDRGAWLARVIAAAEEGEPAARAAILETTRLVGIAAANLAAVIDPSIIVFGGELFSRVPRLVETVAGVVQSIWTAPATIAPAALKEEAPLWGSVLAANKAARVRLRRELWPEWTPSDSESIPDSP